VAPFAPALLRTIPQDCTSVSTIKFSYEIRARGSAKILRLRQDPNIELPVPIWRLAANAAASFVLVLAAGLMVVTTAPRFLGYGSMVVTSGSMEPAIQMADVVLTSPLDGLPLAAGAVINFDSSGGSTLHRIAEVTPDGYRTAGDANPGPDSELVDPAQVRGVGIVVVPYAGLPSIWLENGRWLHLGSSLAALVGAMYVGRVRWIDNYLDRVRS